jgi:urease accessory protein
MKRIAALLALAPIPALAHHPMGGTTPATLWQGFASGIGHPVIGLDHLAFLLAAGVLAATLPTGLGLLAVLGFVAGGFVGSLVHLAGIGLGPVEALVAVSVIAAGGALLWRGAPAAALPAAFAAAGVIHGHAFAEAIIGAETGPLAAYLAALALAQGAIGVGTMLLARRLGDAAPRLHQATGAVAAALGAVFLVLALVA